MQGIINLNLAIILMACIRGDIDYFSSIRFYRTISLMPDSILEHSRGVGLTQMSPKQVGVMLIKRIREGQYKDIDTNKIWGSEDSHGKKY